MELFCRGCLIRYDEPAELLEYTEKNRRLFVYSTGLQVKRNDTFTFQLCKDCYLNMKQACKFKKLCRTSDKKFKTYLSLKEIGDAADLCTYLKTNDDNNIRFPTFAANSTPVNQKNKDGIDDMDESTCTSIGNFMTDILQGEEMPDTEARIIRQVIEEEADVLDDSLDSHWLQDDMSIDTDFRLDFNFSPFSTPKSVANDHFYTPSRLFTPNRPYTPTKLLDEEQIPQHKYVEVPKIVMTKHKDHEYSAPMELLDPPSESHQEANIVIVNKNQLNQKQIGTDLETDQIDTNLEKAVLSIQEELNQETNIFNENQLTQKQIGSDLETNQIDTNLEKAVLSIQEELNRETNIVNEDQLTQKQIGSGLESNVIEELNQETNIIIVYENQSDIINTNVEENFDEVNEESAVDIFNSDGIMDSPQHDENLIILEVDPLSDEQVTNFNNKNYYVDNLVLTEAENNNKLGDSFLVDNQKDMSQIQQDDQPVMITDSIDKNLQNALKGNDQEFALEDLLASPAAVPSKGILSTPSIHNLIFGDITDKDHNQVNLDKNMSVINNNKDDPLCVLNENMDECKNSKLGSISSIEKILFGEKLDEDSNAKKQYPVGDVILENKIDDEADNKSDLFKKIIFGHEFDSKTEENVAVDGSYIEALDEFFNSRDLKPEEYSTNENQENIIKSGVRYDPKTCEEFYDFDNFYCKLCKKTMKNLKSLKIHSSKIHKIMLKLQFYAKVCEICGAVIKDPRNFTRHKQLHEEYNLNKEYKCDMCELSFKQRHHLAKHKRGHLSSPATKPIKKYMCSECGICLSSTTALKVHKRKHTLDYVASCQHCGKGFYAKTHLVDHMRTHTGERPFICIYCSKAFKQSNTLNKHMKMHTGEKKYKCEHCLRLFAHRESIVQHFEKKLCQKLYDKKKKRIFEKYECAFCYNVFSGLSGLLTHQRLSRKCKKKQIIIDRLNAKQNGK